MKLKLSDWASVAEIVGAIAVVISLVYVGAQVRDSTRAVRSAAVNDANLAAQGWYSDISSNRQLTEVWLRSMLSSEPLSSEDEFQFLMSMHAVMLAFQNSYLLSQEGSLDPEVLAGITTPILGVKDLPGMKRYWRQRRSYLHSGFAEYLDSVMDQPAINTVDIYQEALSEPSQ